MRQAETVTCHSAWQQAKAGWACRGAHKRVAGRADQAGPGRLRRGAGAPSPPSCRTAAPPSSHPVPASSRSGAAFRGSERQLPLLLPLPLPLPSLLLLLLLFLLPLLH